MFRGGRLERLECPHCGCVFGPLKYLELPEGLVDLDNRLLYSSYQEGVSTTQEIRAFRALEPRPGGVYLSWGSGLASDAIAILRVEGYDVWGFESHVESGRPFVVRRREEVSANLDGIFTNNMILTSAQSGCAVQRISRHVEAGRPDGARDTLL